jgi:hypothetical protein
MELRQLKMFCAVAEHGNFSAAAESVHCVQSNVTMRVKEPEPEPRIFSRLRRRAPSSGWRMNSSPPAQPWRLSESTDPGRRLLSATF